MITVIDMCCNEIEQETTAIEYGEEIMCAGWNPSVNLVCERLQEVRTAELIPMAVKIATLNSLDNGSMTEPEMYLNNLYRCQR
jgi:hypothetical protein